MLAEVKALTLGGLAAVAALCAGVSVTALAFFLVGLVFFLGDHSNSAAERVARFASGFALAGNFALAARVGWAIGRDWYRNGS